MTRLRLALDDLSRMSYSPHARPRSMVWRDMQNMQCFDGWLGRRAVFQTHPVFGVNSALAVENENPAYVLQEVANPGLGSGLIATVIGRQPYRVDATPTWSSMAVTYSTGTVSVTNGSATVTGSGTSWHTNNNISDYAVIEIGGTFYDLASVDSDTQVTLASNWLGTTASGQAYVIHRRGLGCTAFAEQAGNLYCGYLGMDRNSVFRSSLIEVQDWMGSSPTTRFLTGSTAATISGLDYFTTENMSINSILPLPDGRIVIVANRATSGAIVSRVFYSSPTDLTVWTTGNSGSVDPVGLPGHIVAAVAFADRYLFWTQRGYYNAAFTGRADVPLTFTPVPNVVGPRSQKAMIDTPHGLVFVDREGVARLFDGQDSHPIGDVMRGIQNGLEASGYHGWRDEVAWMDFTANTRYVFSFRDQAWRKEVFAPDPGGGGNFLGGQIVYDGKLNAASTGEVTVAGLGGRGIMVMVEDTSVNDFELYSGDYFVETDDFDLSAAGGDPSDDFFVDGVELWFRSAAASISSGGNRIDVSVSNDGGATWDTKQVTLTMDDEQERCYRVQGFTRQSSVTARLKIELASNKHISDVQISRIVMHLQRTGNRHHRAGDGSTA